MRLSSKLNINNKLCRDIKYKDMDSDELIIMKIVRQIQEKNKFNDLLNCFKHLIYETLWSMTIYTHAFNMLLLECTVN